MTGWGCRFTRSGWRRDGFFGRRRHGVVAISAAQLAYLLDGIDWRNPRQAFLRGFPAFFRSHGAGFVIHFRHGTAAEHDLPNDVDALKAALVAARTHNAQIENELTATRAQLSDDQALIAHLKLVIAKLNRARFGSRSESSVRLLDQLELQLEESPSVWKSRDGRLFIADTENERRTAFNRNGVENLKQLILDRER